MPDPDLETMELEALQRLMFIRNIAMSDAAVECMPKQTANLRSIAASLHYLALDREEQRNKHDKTDVHRSALRRNAFDGVKENPPSEKEQ